MLPVRFVEIGLEKEGAFGGRDSRAAQALLLFPGGSGPVQLKNPQRLCPVRTAQRKGIVSGTEDQVLPRAEPDRIFEGRLRKGDSLKRSRGELMLDNPAQRLVRASLKGGVEELDSRGHASKDLFKLPGGQQRFRHRVVKDLRPIGAGMISAGKGAHQRGHVRLFHKITSYSSYTGGRKTARLEICAVLWYDKSNLKENLQNRHILM